MKHAMTSSYTPPEDTSGLVALGALDYWVEPGLKLEEGKLGLGFPFMYLLLTGTMGIKVPPNPRLEHYACFSSAFFVEQSAHGQEYIHEQEGKKRRY